MAGDKTVTYDIECPNCKTTKYRNPHMKLMVNVCGHALCDNCVKTLFVKESGQCPECDINLKRAKFRVQVFEDPVVEKEIDIRRKLSRIYNKLEDDFATLEEYDDYLEMVETIVYDLTNDINKSEIERKIETYEKQNREQIKRNQFKKSADDEELQKIVEEEKLLNLQRIQEQKKEFERSKLQNQDKNASLLKDLMASDGDASQIVRTHAQKLQIEKQQQDQEDLLNKIESTNPKEFSSGVRIGGSANATVSEASISAMLHQAKLYTYEEPDLAAQLPLPEWDKLESLGYLNHVRQCGSVARAGGYTEQYACMRALHDFMGGHILS